MTKKMEAAKERLNACRRNHIAAQESLKKATTAERDAKTILDRAEQEVAQAVAEWLKQ